MAFDDPATAERAFYAAFRELDLEGMHTVWADAPEISCIHPGGGLLRGRRDVLSSWRDIFHETSPPQVGHRLVQASIDTRLAVHTVEEHISSGSQGHQAVVLATNIYVLLDGGWRMLAHHASLPLVETREPAAENRPLH